MGKYTGVTLPACLPFSLREGPGCMVHMPLISQLSVWFRTAVGEVGREHHIQIAVSENWIKFYDLFLVTSTEWMDQAEFSVLPHSVTTAEVSSFNDFQKTSLYPQHLGSGLAHVTHSLHFR